MYRSVENSTLFLIGEWFTAQYEKVGSGTFGSSLMGGYFISTADPGNIKTVLATEFDNFEKGTPDRTPMGHPLTVPLIRCLRSRSHGVGARRGRFQQ